MCTDPDYITDSLKKTIGVMEAQTGTLKKRFQIEIPKKKRYEEFQTTLATYSLKTDSVISTRQN